MSAEGSPRGTEGVANAAVGLAVVTEVKAELNGVDLDEIEVETEDGGDEKEEDVAGEGVEEGVASYDVVVDVIGPLILKRDERAEDEGGDEEREQGDAEEAPEVEQALVEESCEASGAVGLVAEEGSGNEEEVEEQIERDGGVAGCDSCVCRRDSGGGARTLRRWCRGRSRLRDVGLRASG